MIASSLSTPAMIDFLPSTGSLQLAPKARLSRAARRPVSTFSTLQALEPLQAPAAWQEALLVDVAKLRALRAGWDGRGSLAIDDHLIQRAWLYAKQALDGIETPSPPYLVPGGDGTVQIEWHEVGGELEFHLGAGDHQHIWIKDHLSDAEYEANGREAIALFYRWAPRLASGSNAVNASIPPAVPLLEIAA